MTDLVTVAVIGALAASFGSVMQLITVSKVNKIQVHAEKTAVTVSKTQEDVVELKNQTNGLTAALVKVTGQAEHAKGKIEGAAEEKAHGTE